MKYLIVFLIALLATILLASASGGMIALSDNVYSIDELRQEHGDVDDHLNSNADETGDIQVFVTFRSKLTPEDWKLVHGGEYVPKHTVILLTNVTYAKSVLAKHPRVSHVAVLPHSHKFSKTLFGLDLDSQELLADMAGLSKFALSQSISEESKKTEALDLLIFPTDDVDSLIYKWNRQVKSMFGHLLHKFSIKQVGTKKISAEFTFKSFEERVDNRKDIVDWIAKKHHVRHIQITETFRSEADAVSDADFLQDYATLPISSTYQDLLEKNYKALSVFSLRDVQMFWKNNITGKGSVVGVGDTGMDLTHCMFKDTDHSSVKFSKYPESESAFSKKAEKSSNSLNHRKVKEYWAYVDNDDTRMGHGSHVVGILAGSLQGTDNQNLYTGVAPDARVAFIDLGAPDKTLKLPSDLTASYFPFMAKNGAKIFSNSWGNRNYGAYTLSAREIDYYMWKNPEVLALFAAGNSGREGASTITAPSTAKNCLTVGASEASATNFKFGIPLYSDVMRGSVPCSESSFIFHTPEFCGPDRTLPCSDAETVKKTCHALRSGNDKLAEEVCCKVPFLQKVCCSAYLLKQNLKTYNKNSKEYESNNVAVFSSRGPTLDGRIKPEILTIGQPIFSVRAHGSLFQGKQCPVPQVMQGTSQATPIVAGLAVMLRSYMEKHYADYNNVKNAKQFQPAQIEAFQKDKAYGSLIKALIVNSGSELTGVVDINGQGVIKKLTGFPSFTQGFGVVNLTSIVPWPENNNFLFAQQESLETNQASHFCFVTSKKGHIKKVTLAWSDYPANPNAKFTLVNNLDLIVKTDAEESWGNNAKPNEGDEINVVEQVTLANPSKTVRVTVRGVNVPHGPQPFGLVVSGSGPVEIVKC